MSGFASIILSICGLYADSTKNKSYFWIAAIVCIILAGFFVWYKTHPQLRIQIQECNVAKPEHPDLSLLSLNGKFIIFHLRITNSTQNPTSLVSYEIVLDIAKEKLKLGAVDAQQAYYIYSLKPGMADFLENRTKITLKQGQHKEGWVSFNVSEKEEITNVKFILLITDSYGVIHKTKGVTPLEYKPKLMESKSWRRLYG